MDESQPVERLSLPAFLGTLSRRWYLVLACVLAVPAVAYFLASREEKRYEATAKLLFRDSGRNLLGRGAPTAPGAEDSDRLASTMLDLLTLSPVAERTARSLGGGLSAGLVASHISVEADGKSDIYSVKATSKEPTAAARLANAYADQFVAYRQSVDRNQVAGTRRIFELKLKRTADTPAESARRTELSSRIAHLRTVESLQDGYMEVAQRAAVPGAPVWPRPKRDAVIGGALGLLLGIGLALVFEALDRRLRSLRSVQSSFERPILGGIAESRALSTGGTEPLPPGERESFAMLCANLRFFNQNRPLTSILVTSPAVGEGKSTVAWNLAVAAAEAGMKVLVIEADLRRPALADRVGASPAHGLSDVLAHGTDTAEAVDRVAPGDPETNGSRHAVDVLFGGSPVANPVDWIDSRQMSVLLRGAEMRYDLVVVDSPPLAVVPDAIPLIRQVSGVIVVARLGKTTREAAEHARAQLDNLEAPVLGVVVNNIGRGDGFYPYAYRAATSYAATSESPPAD